MTDIDTRRDLIVVGIPYFAAGAQGRELEFAVAGWRRHFKERHVIAIVGDHHPVCDSGDDIVFIDCPRIAPVDGQYLPALDVINKILHLRDAFPASEGFVWSNDDIYAVNDFDLTDVRFLKMLEGDMPYKPHSANGWHVIMARTKDALRANGKPTRNFSLHLPCWYDWDRLLWLIREFSMRTKGYSFVNMYFNWYFPGRIPLQLNIETDNIKCGLYRENPRMDYVRNAFRTKIWINNSPKGWIPELPRLLAEHYGI